MTYRDSGRNFLCSRRRAKNFSLTMAKSLPVVQTILQSAQLNGGGLMSVVSEVNHQRYS